MPEDGWYVSDIKTNLQETEELEFKDKEDKWFSQIQGVTTELSNIDTKEFSVQGIDNSSFIKVPLISGCTDEGALNYNPNATISDDSCIYCIYGCMTVGSSNYNPNATCDDGSCTECIYGCLNDPAASNYGGLGNINGISPIVTCDDGSCLYTTISTCPPSNHSSPYYQQPYAAGAVNTVWCAECNHAGPGSVFWTQFPDCICCTSAPLIESWDCENGTCYDPGDGNGIYPTQAACQTICNPKVIVGCTDPLATNYNPAATIDDDSCTYLCHLTWKPTIDKIIHDSGVCPLNNYDGEMFASGTIPGWHSGDTWHWNVVRGNQASWPPGGSGQISTSNVNIHFQGPPPPIGSNWWEWVSWGNYMLVITHYRNGGDNSPTGECTYTKEFTINCQLRMA